MKNFRLLGAAAAMAICQAALAQTSIDLRTQSKSVDFSGAVSTKPFKTGMALPATCAVGEIFFNTNAPAGKNLYGCGATDQWSLLGTPIDLPPPAGNNNKVLSNDGASVSWRVLGGDVSGTADALTVSRLQGRDMSSTAPANRDILKWNQASNQWDPTADYGAGAGIKITGAMISVEDAVTPFYYLGAGAPAVSCFAGRDFYIDSTNGLLYFCWSTDTWRQVSIQGHTHTATEIGSGTLDAARLPVNSVLADRAQTYSAGQKQTFQPSAASAGLRVVSGTLPSSPAPGDLAIDSGDGNKLKFYDGSAWQTSGGGGGGTTYSFRDALVESAGKVDHTPNDPRVVVIEDELLSGSFSSGQIGSTGMAAPITCTGGGFSGVTGAWPNLGIVRVATGTTSGNACALGWTSVSTGAFGALGANTDKFWEFQWVGRLNTTGNIRFRMGFGTCNTSQPANMFGMRFDTTGSFADSANFRIFNRTASGTEDAADSGWPVDSNFHSIRISSDAATAGKVYVSFDGGTAKTICASGCDLTATPHTADGTFCAIIVTDTTTAASVDNDKFSFKARVNSGSVTKRN